MLMPEPDRDVIARREAPGPVPAETGQAAR